MDPVPLIRTSQLAPFVTALERVGLPLEPYLRRARLPLAWREQPNSLISERQLWKFIGEVSQREGICDLGLRATRDGQVADIGPFGLRLAQSITLLDALRTLGEEVETHSSHARFGLSVGIDQARFWRRGVEGIDVGQDQVEQYTLLLMIQIVQLAAGPHWRPARIQLQAARARWLPDAECLHEARVTLGATATSVDLPVELLSRPLPRRILMPEIPAAIEPLPAANFADSLRQTLESLVGQEPLSISLASEIAGTSVRTLERRLQETGLSWRRLFDQIQCDAAVRLLDDPKQRITDVAHELGYSDSANFNRAFKRWTGVAPSKFRLR